MSHQKGRRSVIFAIESLESRQLLSSSISGNIWNDANANKLRDAAEAGLSGWTVYLDQNRSRTRDAGEVFTQTDANGDYAFAGLNSGTYYVAEETAAGWSLTSPTASSAVSLGAAPAGAVNMSAQQSNTLIGLDTLRNDPRFNRADGTGYSIAIIDTGIDADNPFFGPDADGNGVADRIVYQAEFSGTSPTTTPSVVADADGHGTAVASIAASSNGTYQGMAPGANIVSLKAIGGMVWGSLSPAERALQWVIANADEYNIVSINISIGDGSNYSTTQVQSLSDEFSTLSNMGIVVVASAGNDFGKYNTPGVAYPGADANVISVGAVYDANVGTLAWPNSTDYTTAADRITSYSQRWQNSFIFAPGSVITTASLSNGTTSFNGTSAAAPHVAGAAVVAQQLAELELGRRLTTAEFLNLIKTSGNTIFDGDDENDSVTNTNLAYQRLNVQAMAVVIWNLASSYLQGYTVTVDGSNTVASQSFGGQALANVPGAPDLVDLTDSGASTTDNITRFNGSNGKLTFVVPHTTAGGTLKLYGNGQLLATTSTKAYLTYVSVSGVALADGTYAFTATQTLPGLTESAKSAAVSVTIDTVAPSAPSAPDLVDTSDSGISATDNITNLDGITFAMGPTGYYRLYRDGATYDMDFYLASTLGDNNRPDGAYSYTATMSDSAGNESSQSAATVVTRDRTAWPVSSGMDSTFATNGYKLIPGGQATAVAVGADGKIIVGIISGEQPNVPDSTTMMVTRLLANGTVDTTFGTNGTSTLSSMGYGQIKDLEVLADGRILVGCQVGTYARHAGVVRLTASGQIDTAFATSGVYTGGPANLLESIFRRMADGRLVVMDYYSTTGMRLTRLTADGALDSTFNGTGRSIITFAEQVAVSEFVVAADNSLYIAGRTYSGDRIALGHIKSDGKVDTAFGTNGSLFTTVTGASGVNAMLAQPDGKIIVAGQEYLVGGSSTDDTLLIRYNANGTLDAGFGTGGIVISSRFTNAEFLRNAVLDAKGRIVAVYYSSSGLSAARFNTDGSVDQTFGPNGTQAVPVVSEGYGYGVAIDASGKILLSGLAYQQSSAYATVARLMADKTPVDPLVLQPASDTGSNNADGITTDLTPTFDVPSLPAGHYFRVFANGTLTGQLYESGSTYTPSPLQPGTYNFSIMAIDAAGNASGESGTTTVVIEALPVITVIATDPNAAEPSDTGTFTITRSGSTADALTVYYTMPQDAFASQVSNGVDYQTLTGMVVIGQGKSSATVMVVPIDDVLVEGTEAVTLSILADPAYTLGATAQADVLLVDNDSTMPAPIAWYQLDETSGTAAADASGNNTAALVNAPTVITGKSGNAIALNGSTQYATAANVAALNPTSAITLSAWVNATNWTGNRRILQKGLTDNQYRLLGENGLLKFDLKGVGSITAALPSAGAWHLITGTYDGAKMTLYVDGISVASASKTGTIAVTADPLYIGTKKAGDTTAGDFFKGKIDDVRVYGQALTAAEVLTLANG